MLRLPDMASANWVITRKSTIAWGNWRRMARNTGVVRMISPMELIRITSMFNLSFLVWAF